jgi:hypothetical protein
MSQLGQKRKSRPCGGMSALLRDTVAKGLLGGDRNFSGPLMRFARGEMRDHIVCTKTTRELRIGVTEYCSGHVGQKSTFARLLTSFDFRLLQQYPPGERTSSGCLGMSEKCSKTRTSSWFYSMSSSARPHNGDAECLCSLGRIHAVDAAV